MSRLPERPADRIDALIRERDTLAARIRAADEEIRELREALDRLRAAEDAARRVGGVQATPTAYRITGGHTGDPAASWRVPGGGDE